MLLRNLPIQLDEEVTILLNMDKDLASAMNKWRLEQDPPLDPVAAIHVLLRRALEADGYTPATDIEQTKDRELQELVRAFQAVSR